MVIFKRRQGCARLKINGVIMSRRPADPANLPLFDFGSVGCAARAVPVASHFIEPTARPKVTELDRRLIEMWLHGKSIHTQRAYQRAADRFLEVVAKPLSNVTLGDFQRFTDTLTGKASSRAQVIASVTALLSFGWRLGVLRANVGLALSRIDAPDRLADRILSETEVARMLEYSNGRDHVLVRLLYAGGFRVSELLGLRWNNIVAATDGTAYVSVVGKGRKARTIRVSPATAAVLYNYRFGAPQGAYVFPGRTGGLDPSQAWRIVQDVARRAGIARSVSPHFMRHAHATHAIDRGATITTVRDTLGHSSIAVTDRYAHVRPAESSGLVLAI